MRPAKYYLPLLIAAAIALAPAAFVLLSLKPPADIAGARAQLRIIYALVAVAWIGQLALAGSVANLVARAPGPLRALPVALGGLAAAVPATIIAVVMIAIGALALAAPGVVLLVLLAPIGAVAIGAPDTAGALATALRETPWKRAAIVVAIALLVDVAVVFVGQRVLIPLNTAKPKPAELADVVTFARLVVLAWIVVSPAIAIALTSLRRKIDR